MLPSTSASFGFCRHFECVLLNTIVKLPREVVLLNLTNRFHVAVRLYSKSEMTSKCGKNKKVAHEAIAECVTYVLTTLHISGL